MDVTLVAGGFHCIFVSGGLDFFSAHEVAVRVLEI
jgi:hypothetical protein